MRTKILSPLRRDGIKAGMMIIVMALSAMLLTSACSSEDDLVNNTAENTEAVANKGYALPVTVNVTRQADGTRATFDGSKLNFGAGDKLFVEGKYATGSKSFAGALDYVSEGTFSGTIYAQDNTYSTYDALLTAASSVTATLLPNYYESTGFLSINNNSTTDIAYDDRVSVLGSYAFVASETAKATGVEQLSLERASTYSSGFALAPGNAILNFTITGLEAGAKDVLLHIHHGFDYDVFGSVTPNASGVATFAVGVPVGANIKDMDNNLTVGSSKFTLPSSTTFTVGKIYNITRSIVDLSTISSNYTAQNGEILTGTLGENVKISIAAGATVTLDGVTIDGENVNEYNFAGLTCLGDATIILSGTNTVKGFLGYYPGIHVPADHTVTIKGSGSLTASSNGGSAGIGGGMGLACGNIEIQGGTVTATGGNSAAGIGSGGNGSICGTITISGGTVTATGGNYAAGIGSGGSGASCGTITISGGTVTATGGNYAAGIGSSVSGTSCGAINITSGVTHVTATKGSYALNSIGAGASGTCGTVSIEDGANVTQN